MPEYSQENNAPYKTIYVHFRNENDLSKIIGVDLDFCGSAKPKSRLENSHELINKIMAHY